jgi:DNA-binding CsgD family transcriptional regulator
MLAELSEYTTADRYFDEAEAICTRNGYGHMNDMVTTGHGFLEACASDAEIGHRTINALLAGNLVQHDSEIHAMTLVDMALICRLVGRQVDAFDYCFQGLAVAREHELLRPVLHLETLSEYLLCRSDATHSTSGLQAIAVRAKSAGYLDIPHKCRFYAGVVAYARDQRPDALDEMAEEAEELLRLGFRRFMAIELATEPDLALPLATQLTDTQAAFLMAALARTPPASPILFRFIDADPRLAEIAAETAATEFDDKLWARFARTARRSGSPRLRRTAARLSADRDPARRAAGQAEGLTRRETEVLSLIAEGQRNAEIAATLFLSEKTVKTHVNHVFTKLEVRDRVQAVLYYREHLDRE